MRFCWPTLHNGGSPRRLTLSILIAAVALIFVTSESSAQMMRGRGGKGPKGAGAAGAPATPAAEKPPGPPLTKTQAIFSLIQSLTINQSDAARDLLQQIIEGKISFGGHDKQAAEMALAALAMRPGADGGAIVLKIAAEPDTQLRPNDKVYPAAAVRYDAVRVLGKIGSPEIRVDLAKLHDMTTPEVRTAIEAALTKPSPANFAAQVVLVRSRLLPETMRYDLQKQILEQNSAALKQALKLAGETPNVAAAGLAPAALFAQLQRIAAAGNAGDPGANPLSTLQALPAVPAAPNGGPPGLPPAGLQGAPPAGPQSALSRSAAAEALQNPVALLLDFTEKVFNATPIDTAVVARQLWQNGFVETLPPKLTKGANADQVLAAVGSIPLKAARERLRDYLEDKSPSELGKAEAPVARPAPIQSDKPSSGSSKRAPKSGGAGSGGLGNGTPQGGLGQAGMGQPGMGRAGMGQAGLNPNGGMPQNGMPQNGMPQNGMPQGGNVPGMVQAPGGALVPGSWIPGSTLPGGIPLGGFGNNNNNNNNNWMQQGGQNGMGQNGMGQNGMGQGMAQNGVPPGGAAPGGFGGFGAGGTGNGAMGNGGAGNGGSGHGAGPGAGGMGHLGGAGRQTQPAPVSQGPVYVVGKDWLDPGAVVALKSLTYKDRPKNKHHTTTPGYGGGSPGRRSPAAEKRAEEAAEKQKQAEMQFEWRDTIERFVSHWDDRLSAVAQPPAEGAADSDTSEKADAGNSKTGASSGVKKSKAAEGKSSHAAKSKGAAPTPSVAVPFALKQGERITKEFHLRWPEDLPANLTSAVTEPLVLHYVQLDATDEVNRTATFYRTCLSKGTHTHTQSATHELDDGKWVDIMQRDPGAHRTRTVDILITRRAPDGDTKRLKTEELSVQILMVEVESFGPEPKSTEKTEKEQAKSETP
jgi:hypothetical protein